jgi:predicted RNA binding protein YcfA (HicA-like mRNA interferase family)
MSPRLPRITASELIRALHRDGWFDVRQSGSHLVLRHATKPGRVVVPWHSGAILKPKILADALEQTGLSIDDLRDLL